MSITSPSVFTKWATSGDIVIPSDGKKITGWIVEKPPHQFFNWIQNNGYLWEVFLDSLQFNNYDFALNWEFQQSGAPSPDATFNIAGLGDAIDRFFLGTETADDIERYQTLIDQLTALSLI